ncbi:AAA family ATPase [Nocardia terpenica]|uniref:AAA family ATPase n=1 Tax=Nocardia terpenica TaxID=455432 RepID=UPI0008308DE8|nr:AAA family ATPase [Nocardia terpenica]
MVTTLFVPGVPAPQGSKRHVGNGRMIESSPRLKPWRETVNAAARTAGVPLYEGPVVLGMEFVLPRPKSTPKTRPTPPATKRPDIEKLARAVADAIDGIAYRDDSQVVAMPLAKRIAEPDEPSGVHIQIATYTAESVHIISTGMYRSSIMTELVITRGWPGSGKTTRARTWVEQAEGRVKGPSRDDLRASLFNRSGILTGEQEQLITRVQEAAVRALIAAGRSVIVDDTNLRLAHARRWADLAAELGADFQVLDIKTKLEQCLDNNEERARRSGGRYVDPDTIRQIAEQFPVTQWPEVKASEGVDQAAANEVI